MTKATGPELTVFVPLADPNSVKIQALVQDSQGNVYGVTAEGLPCRFDRSAPGGWALLDTFHLPQDTVLTKICCTEGDTPRVYGLGDDGIIYRINPDADCSDQSGRSYKFSDFSLTDSFAWGLDSDNGGTLYRSHDLSQYRPDKPPGGSVTAVSAKNYGTYVECAASDAAGDVYHQAHDSGSPHWGPWRKYDHIPIDHGVAQVALGPENSFATLMNNSAVGESTGSNFALFKTASMQAIANKYSKQIVTIDEDGNVLAGYRVRLFKRRITFQKKMLVWKAESPLSWMSQLHQDKSFTNEWYIGVVADLREPSDSLDDGDDPHKVILPHMYRVVLLPADEKTATTGVVQGDPAIVGSARVKGFRLDAVADRLNQPDTFMLSLTPGGSLDGNFVGGLFHEATGAQLYPLGGPPLRTGVPQPAACGPIKTSTTGNLSFSEVD